MVWVLPCYRYQLISWKWHKDFHLPCLKTIDNRFSLLIWASWERERLTRQCGFLSPYLVDFLEGLPVLFYENILVTFILNMLGECDGFSLAIVLD